MDKLTQDVLLYNRLRCTLKVPKRSKKYLDLEKSIMERCSLMIYRVPTETRLLEQENCAEFLLRCMPNVKSMVANFKDFGIPFEAYMNKIIRARARTFYAEKKQERYKEQLILYCCAAEGVVVPSVYPDIHRVPDTTDEGLDITSPNQEDYERWNLYERYRSLRRFPTSKKNNVAHRIGTKKTIDTDTDMITAETVPLYGIMTTAQQSMGRNPDASKLFRELSSRPSRKELCSPGHLQKQDEASLQSHLLLKQENPAVAKLQQALQSPIQRRRLLTLMLSHPEEVTPALIDHMSSIMDIDDFELAQLVRIANEATFSKQARKSKLQSTINKHWTRTIYQEQQLRTLRTQAYHNANRIQKLEREKAWTQGVLMERRREILRSSRGLSSTQLANLLGIPKGTVCSGMFYARKLLTECMEEDIQQ